MVLASWGVAVEAVVAVAVMSALLISVVEPVSLVALTLVASVLLATSGAAAAVPVGLFTASRIVVTGSSVEGAPVPFSSTRSSTCWFLVRLPAVFHGVSFLLAEGARL